jgi:SAM-dependent methyltransferase
MPVVPTSNPAPPPPDPLAGAREYEASLVPALMQEWAPRLVAAARIQPGNHVLDVACGTGVLTREVAARLAGSGSVIGLDIDPGMLSVARGVRPDLEWQEGSAEHLPWPDARFDAVVSQFGLMFVPSPPRALAEMWRGLKPGGRLAVAVWASLETLTTVVGAGRFPSIRAMVAADVIGWLPVTGMTLPSVIVEAILSEAEVVLAPYRQPDGSVQFDSPAHIAVATRQAAP